MPLNMPKTKVLSFFTSLRHILQNIHNQLLGKKNSHVENFSLHVLYRIVKILIQRGLRMQM